MPDYSRKIKEVHTNPLTKLVTTTYADGLDPEQTEELYGVVTKATNMRGIVTFEVPNEVSPIPISADLGDDPGNVPMGRPVVIQSVPSEPTPEPESAPKPEAPEA